MASRAHKLQYPDKNVVLALGGAGLGVGESVFFVVYGVDVDSGVLIDSKDNVYTAIIETPTMALFAGGIRNQMEGFDSITFEGGHDTTRVEYVLFVSGDFTSSDIDAMHDLVKPGKGKETDGQAELKEATDSLEAQGCIAD